MALRDLLLECAPVVGVQLNDAASKSWLIQKINGAAREIYDSSDLLGSLREQEFTIDESNQQISLPWYVERVRAVRISTSGAKVQLTSMRPRYQTGAWNQDLLSWRIKGFSPTKTNITNESALTLTIPTADTVRFSVSVTGPTQHASNITDTVTFEVGDTTKTTTLQFTADPELRAIRKNVANNRDVTVTDAGGTELAIVPNSELESRYTIIQINDQTTSASGTNNYEVLFTMRFTPFVNDYDEFPCRGYDKAIYWKTLEHIWAERQDEGDRAVGAHEKCLEVLRQVSASQTAGQEMMMDFGTNRFFGLTDDLRSVERLYPMRGY